ncbi:hypothetical protein TUN205_09470 [Pyrenophora tritici-repentis]|nr:hypothetical protein TUN205_09470 [Pyrenophora tritici-repentis]
MMRDRISSLEKANSAASELVCWVFQIQLLPQIIINRIRIILQDKKRGRRLTVITAIIITLINISVFCIWIPARLQISDRWIHINSIWDRTEKVLFLLLDGYLNYYFIRVVNADLVRNGLTKYNRLVRFNKRIIVVSLSLDVMIIGAMSIPNGFVYAMFHPLAYIVKLNIEMSMAHLIKTIVLDNRHTVCDPHLLLTYKSSPESDVLNTNLFAEVPRHRLSLIRGLFGGEHVVFPQEDVRARELQDVSIQTTSIPDSETPLRKHVAKKEAGTSSGDNLSIYDAQGNRNDDVENVTGNDENMDGIEMLGGIPPITLPEPVLLPARMSDAD